MKIAVIGLGYVGLPLATALGNEFQIIGFDINQKRIKELNNGYDSTNELTSEQVKKQLNNNIIYTNEEIRLDDSNFYIVTVPTPIDKHKKPDLKVRDVWAYEKMGVFWVDGMKEEMERDVRQKFKVRRIIRENIDNRNIMNLYNVTDYKAIKEFIYG